MGILSTLAGGDPAIHTTTPADLTQPFFAKIVERSSFTGLEVPLFPADGPGNETAKLNALSN
jgi:hypothetical protein